MRTTSKLRSSSYFRTAAPPCSATTTSCPSFFKRCEMIMRLTIWWSRLRVSNLVLRPRRYSTTHLILDNENTQRVDGILGCGNLGRSRTIRTLGQMRGGCRAVLFGRCRSRSRNIAGCRRLPGRDLREGCPSAFIAAVRGPRLACEGRLREAFFGRGAVAEEIGAFEGCAEAGRRGRRSCRVSHTRSA